MGVGSDRAKKAKAQQLRLEYEVVSLCDGEAVLFHRLQLLVSQLEALAVTIADEKVVAMTGERSKMARGG